LIVVDRKIENGRGYSALRRISREEITQWIGIETILRGCRSLHEVARGSSLRALLISPTSARVPGPTRCRVALTTRRAN